MNRFFDRLRVHLAGLQTDLRTIKIANQVADNSPESDGKKPTIILFNASTRLNTLSQNAAFAMLAGWALQLAGNRVVHFVCQAGMTRCVLGTDQNNFSQQPPCRSCIRQSRLNTHASRVYPFTYHPQEEIQASLQDLSLPDLKAFQAKLQNDLIPLGELVLPSIRWRLRCSDLQDDDQTRFLYRQYILSAWNVAMEFQKLVHESSPQAALIFNGQFFPEAIVRWICRKQGIHSITHEVGMQPVSGFFTEGEATAYPVDMPSDFHLTADQDFRLDAYLGKRMQGDFTMAGISFWPEMKSLDFGFLEKAGKYKQIVPIFTNVIFDTSQPHSNTVFPDMFTWLDLILNLVKTNPHTLFVLRAHPDEKREGKQSLQSVASWVEQNHAQDLENLAFVDSLEYLSSYDLINRSKFIMIYNSTIGMEAAVMGKVVLAAGRSRFSPYQMVHFPQTPAEYRRMAENFLADQKLEPPPEFRLNARRFLYYLLFQTVIPFDPFLEPSRVPGVIQLKNFSWKEIKESPQLQVVVNGVIARTPFIYPQEQI